MLTVGDKFPACSLQGVNENNDFVEVKIDNGYTPHKKDWSVVYFYPKDFTPGCTVESCGFRDRYEEFVEQGNFYNFCAFTFFLEITTVFSYFRSLKLSRCEHY